MPGRLRRAVLRPLAVVCTVAVAIPLAAAANAEPSSSEVRRKLEVTAQRLHHAEEQEAELTDDLENLQRKIDKAELERAGVHDQVEAYARSAYKSGHTRDPILTLIVGSPTGDPLGKVARLDQAGKQARLTIARALALHRELRVSRAAVVERTNKLAAVRAKLSADGAELESLFALVSAREGAAEAKLAAEAARLRRVRLAREKAAIESAREARQLRASRARRAVAEAASNERDSSPADNSSTSSDSTSDDSDSPEGDDSPSDDSASVSGGGFACAVGPANTFRNTWGDRRSGGRRHKGTDVFAPHGSPIYAVTDGRIAGTRSGGLGGKSLILRGDNGDSYYYAHNSAHSVGAGERVRAGERIGSVGATGNAAGGAAHVHFERWPGGGRPTNPYSFLRRVCG